MITLIESCESVWAKTVSCSGLSYDQTAGEYHSLIHAYDEPHRHYHNLRHLSDLFNFVWPFESTATDFTSILWSIWYHDSVYDPRANDNEERSAESAERILRTWGIDLARIERVTSFILETKHSGAGPSSADAALSLDADLSILGADPERYDHYARGIRAEYEFVPEPTYRAGRSDVLRKFLLRPRIYHTSEIHHNLEDVARANLQRELCRLSV